MRRSTTALALLRSSAGARLAQERPGLIPVERLCQQIGIDLEVRFHPRCRYATEICREVEPPLTNYGNSHFAACHHPLNVDKETLAHVTVSEKHTPDSADEQASPTEPAGKESRPIPNP